MIDFMLSVLRAASKEILDIYGDTDRFQTEIKSDNSPLTAADKKSNEIIVAALAEQYPGIPVISEESSQLPYEAREGYEKYFLVDPLDGTKEFIKRNGEFTINIAYMEGNHPVGGFVFVPVTGIAYMAEKGRGAFRIDDRNERVELRTSPFYLKDPHLKIVASRSHRDPRTERIISMFKEPEMITVGSSLKFLKIADGLAHLYPRFGPTMEWDTAAAQCILEEAGGSVIDAITFEPLRYNKEDLLNPHFLAIGSLLDPESLQGMVRRV